MKNIYTITKGQLISLWLFGFIGWVISIYQLDYNDAALFFVVLIPAIIIFYSIGWTTHRKKVGSDSELVPLNKKTLLKKGLKILLIVVLLAGISGYALYKYTEISEKKDAKEIYLGTFNRYDKNLENAKSCVEEKKGYSSAGFH